MSDKSSIEWTDATWNPIRGTIGRHHCVRISEGCKHCYASTMNHRFGGPDYVKGADTPRLDEEALLQPLKWKRARRIFVCSMTDLFMDEHSDEMIGRVWGMMEQAHQHTFQVLTKRAKRMREWLSSFPKHMTLENVWLGVSAENQARADERIPDLLATPAAVRFVSAEPLLGPIEFTGRIFADWWQSFDPPELVGVDPSTKLDWVIVGGESGPGARPCDVSWIRSIKDQCQSAGVPVFVKQLGSRCVETDEFHDGSEECCVAGLKDRKGGDPSEWPAHLRVRQMPDGRNQ